MAVDHPALVGETVLDDVHDGVLDLLSVCVAQIVWEVWRWSYVHARRWLRSRVESGTHHDWTEALARRGWDEMLSEPDVLGASMRGSDPL